MTDDGPGPVFDLSKIVADKHLNLDEFAVATRARRLDGAGPAVVLEGVMTSIMGKDHVKKLGAIMVTCCDMDRIFEVECLPAEGVDARTLLKNTYIHIAKAAAFQCPKCQEWTIVEPTPPDGRLTVTKVKSFSPEISLLLRLLLELGDCIADNGLDLDGGCGECPFCLLKAKFKG